MDGATLQSRVYAGYGKAAKVLGASFNLYRPIAATSPLVNLITTINAAFDSSSRFNFNAPNKYGNSVLYALIDGAIIQAGDYLTNNSNKYFVTGKQALMPVMAVKCNRVLTASRQASVSGVGAVNYGGITSAKAVNILTAWPASVLIGGKSQNTTLAGSVRQAGWVILLPPSVPIELKEGDYFTDELNRRYACESCELTDLGWRINATETHA